MLVEGTSILDIPFAHIDKDSWCWITLQWQLCPCMVVVEMMMAMMVIIGFTDATLGLLGKVGKQCCKLL